ncbi:MAG: alpha-amylase [Acidobacteria bacterium]|nr:alpha-amylase [Acidobacteriota bacterium]
MAPNVVSPTPPWWQTAVVYQIYPRSFCDTSGNGIGDIEGIRSRLDHLEWLGVDALWMSPVFTSPMADHGYDVADYCDIDPLFGDLAAMDTLLADVHDRGMRVILDWVPNHTSDQHRWFMESRSSNDNPRRDWYYWREGTSDKPPNNWQAVFPAGPAWTFDEASGEWYLHLFTPDQPDLNWNNPDVRAAMADTLRFWLDRGVDGFRMDVVHMIGKDPTLPDLLSGPGSPLLEYDEPSTHQHLREIRRVLDAYDGDRCSVGEVYLLEPDVVATYYGNDDELHMSFNFMSVWTGWDADAWRRVVKGAQDAFDPVGGWPTWVLSNHDLPRHRQRFGGDAAIARAAVLLLLCLRGTPFMYAGEELGLVDAEVAPDQIQDPSGSRDGCRAPIPWEPGHGHGWPAAKNWLPFPPEAALRNAQTQRVDPASIAWLYKDVLAERRGSSALQRGSQELLEGLCDGILAWRRSYEDDERIIVINMTNEDVEIDLAEPTMIRMSSVASHQNGNEDHAFDGGIPANSGMILVPRR